VLVATSCGGALKRYFRKRSAARFGNGTRRIAQVAASDGAEIVGKCRDHSSGKG
jgi:hypothetical protein